MGRHKTRDKRLGAILKDILFLMAKFNVHLEVKHVMGEKNPIADALSRVHMVKSVTCVNELRQKGYAQQFVDSSHYVVNNDILSFVLGHSNPYSVAAMSRALNLYRSKTMINYRRQFKLFVLFIVYTSPHCVICN